jgi:hypothetical protein
MPSRPQRPGDGARLPLLETARALAARQERPAARHRLVYQIVGGPPGKRIERTLTITGSGAATLDIKDDLLPDAGRRVAAKIGRPQIERLFRELVESRLFENVESGGGFVPDSTIGIIGFDDGTQAFRYYFPVDVDAVDRAQRTRDVNPSLQRMSAVFESVVDGLLAGK